MNIVTTIMRQHRRIQWLEAAIQSRRRLQAVMIPELTEAVMAHVASTDGVLPGIGDETVAREARAHRVHHERLRLVLHRLSTPHEDPHGGELEVLGRLLREHALHEMAVVRGLRALAEERLEALGQQLADVERARVPRAAVAAGAARAAR